MNMADAVVELTSGFARGVVEKHEDGFNYHAFKGIPYAEPPVGELRFEDPIPVKKWQGIRDCKNYGNMYLHGHGDKHGGAFTFGSGDDTFYGPKYLIRKDVVLVTCNYRLGILGFLKEDEFAPGNQGLKDLVMVLKWVRQNIRVFGGNPDNVTIFGAGTGGVAAHYMALSPLTKGLHYITRYV